MKKLLRTIWILIGFGIGPGIVELVNQIVRKVGLNTIQDLFVPWSVLFIYLASGVVTGIIFIFLSRPLTEAMMRLIKRVDAKISQMPSGVIFSGALGLIIGLLIAYLLTGIVSNLEVPWLSTIFSVLIYLCTCYICVGITIKKKADIKLFGFGRRKGEKHEEAPLAPKILDTSVIIDGRIFDLCQTGFIEGTIVIPNFVLEELRHISDSADNLKRNRGRRGLDVLNKIQKELKMPLSIVDTDYEDTTEVDSKLLKLAKELNGKVLTNDYNLNKVAAVSGVSVLNINELSNAIKPVVLPGEEMTVQIVKDGKEQRQGIAYLDDGTMIVVEDGRGRIGETMRVIVTSVLQTAAGRMIFAKRKQEEEKETL